MGLIYTPERQELGNIKCMLKKQAALTALCPSTYIDQDTNRLTEVLSEPLKFVLGLLAHGKVLVFCRDARKIISVSTMLYYNYVFYKYKVEPYISSHILQLIIVLLSVKNDLWERRSWNLRNLGLLNFFF